ncbi:transcription factor TFIIIB complex subunit brf1 [Pseudohyphozyma bogoriensis]|nr:transcription factor TFIIIB complex subunit brf1 [Pseudohyphozyma bogoriensis]
MICPTCSEDALIEVDGSAGNSVCTRCGTVLEENAIVSEITFGETSGGAAMVQGSYVGADQTRARVPAGYRQKGGSQESREQTMMNGRRRIQALATALRLPDRLSDAGQRYFNLAVNMNFVQGRRTQYVVAACLYSACRMDKTSHMLIDFSDLLEINVFVLGSTYLKLVKELSLQLPSVDPSLYISRFAALLEFGDETQKVAQDAVRLVARMGRDWMHIGRRPAGVCGACLLLAARMNNFRRSITEVVQVVKIADVTLRKRLGEFKDTPSGALTVADFRTLWLDETADPPAFLKSQQREKREREEREAKARAKEEGFGSDDEGDESGGVAFRELAARSSPGLFAGRDSSEPPMSAKAKGKRKRVDGDDSDEDEDEDEELPEEANPLADEPELDEVIAASFQETLGSEAGKKLTDELDKAQLRRLESSSKMTNLNTSDRLDDLDEDELDLFILTPKEVEDKSRLWMENNREYLQQLADKQTGPDGELRPEAKRRIRKRHKPRDSTTAQGVNAADATKQMLTKKKFSKKINYAAVDSLFSKEESVDFEAAGPLLGKTAGTPSRVRRGTPIIVPMPTFSSSRAGTPVAPSRQNSVAPSPSLRRVELAAPEPVEDEEEEVEEDEEVEEVVMARQEHVVEQEEEQEEQLEEWQKMMGHGDADEEDYGYGDEY